MKILLLTHGFPPAQSAGAEVYAAATARAFVQRGQKVTVLAPTDAGDAADYAVHAEARTDGLTVLRVTNRYRDLFDLSWTYANPRMAQVLGDVIERERPDVMHVHHTIGTSALAIAAARRLGVPVVVTLHDYWFVCARGQRLMPNGHLCVDIEPGRCASCIVGKRLAYAAGNASGWLRGRHPRAPVRMLQRIVTLAPELIRHVRQEAGSQAIRRRTAALLAALGEANVVLAPSRFLLQQHVRAGLPAARLRHWPYGIDHAPFAGSVRTPAADGRLRFGYVGSLQASKGVDLLVRAFRAMPAERARLTVHGGATGRDGSAYLRQLQALATPDNGQAAADIRFAGPFDHDRIAAVLSDLDVLVVPSRWYENWPLTLLESVLAGVATVTTGHGSMQEFADTFQTAVTFAADDAVDLGRALQRFLIEPDLAVRLGSGASTPVRTIEHDAEALLQLYEELGAGAVGGGR